jgi:hypothetical protein
MRRTSLAALVILAASLPAQGPRGVPDKPPADRVWDQTRDPSLLVVKFVEGAPVRLVDGAWRGRTDLAAANALLQQAVSVRRLFLRDEADLDRERAALLADLRPGVDPPADLNNYYHVQAAGEADGLRLLRAFNALDVVEIAFPEHRPTVPCEPGDIPPVTPDFSAGQDYRDPAPAGIDQRASRVIPGGRGSGLSVIDIESSWRMNHEDIPQLVPANVIGPHNESLNPNHGVAVIGELAGEWDEFGISGLVDLSSVKVHSHQRQFWASSVNTAAANLPVGGFIVLEVQLTFQGWLVPMETREDVFDAVRNATMAGKFVIAAAGNGSADLDDPLFGNRFNRSFRDSGAVIVGATNGSALARAGFSNFGSIVDANGWGQSVTTTGYGDLFDPGDVRQQYTAVFSGTSSATPIVTGAAMALVGAVREQTGVLLTPAELRAALQQHGTPVPGGSIGVRPDLAQLLAAHGLPNGLDLPVEARLGESMMLALSASAGTGYALMVAPLSGVADLGAAGRFLLDPLTTIVPFAGTVPAGGSETIPLAIPNLPALKKLSLFFQGALLTGSGLRLTSSVQNYMY